jgi:mevalonate kinase
MPFKASAPGSLMLLGEYAVLYQKHALVCALDARITVSLSTRPDQHIHIDAGSFGHYQTTLTAINIEPPFVFVLSIIKAYARYFKCGFDLQISSEMPANIGFGSSAAVTVATLAVLQLALNKPLAAKSLVKKARAVIYQVQGSGSGADAAASVYGGLVAYQAKPLCIEKINVCPPIVAAYAGFKTATSDAIKIVQAQFSSHPAVFKSLIQSIAVCASDGIAATRKQDWPALGKIMNVQQGLMAALLVNLPALQHLIDSFIAEPSIFGAKISGSGLGDCVVGLGTLPEAVAHLPVSISMQGVHCEKI